MADNQKPLNEEIEEFKKHAHELVEWIGDYYKNVRNYPVKAKVKPREVYDSLEQCFPKDGQEMDVIFKDFNEKIIPGMTHWQSPGFHAYFTANTSFPSLLGEMLTATMGAQCMIWDTSPAAAELEELVMNWLRDMMGLPSTFTGVIQDTASTATLCALLTAREKITGYDSNENGLFGQKPMRIYCSQEAHSSVEKAAKIAGFGRNNVIKIPVDSSLALDVSALENAIEKDLENGLQPLAVVAALGTTGTLAIDPLENIAAICKKYSLWLHVDAAYAGSVLLLEDYRWMIKGVEQVDSFVFNPHKWLFTHFDCSAYFVKDPNALVKTFSILPEYLKTNTTGMVNDYRDWGIQLGRRFRSLKLWFVIRSFGLKRIQEIISNHIQWAEDVAHEMKATYPFKVKILSLNLICFRLEPEDFNEHDINTLNKEFNDHLNSSGKVYLTHTKVNDQYLIRMVIGQTYITKNDITNSWEYIKSASESFIHKKSA